MKPPVECTACGLAPCDLPDGVDPDLAFDLGEDGNWYDRGCLAGGADQATPIDGDDSCAS